MNLPRLTTALALSLSALAAGSTIGCHDNAGHNAAGHGDRHGMTAADGNRPLEGNPGATTGPATGYPANSGATYHPLTNDTRQYTPANPASVQPNR